MHRLPVIHPLSILMVLMACRVLAPPPEAIGIFYSVSLSWLGVQSIHALANIHAAMTARFICKGPLLLKNPSSTKHFGTSKYGAMARALLNDAPHENLSCMKPKEQNASHYQLHLWIWVMLWIPNTLVSVLVHDCTEQRTLLTCKRLWGTNPCICWLGRLQLIVDLLQDHAWLK